MELIDLRLNRVIIHEVFQRTNDRTRVSPQLGTTLEHLDGDAIDALRNRIVSAMASPAKCLQMAIEKAGAGSMFSMAAQLADADEALFIDRSKNVADLLADAQKSRSIPGGILIVFSGSAGVPARRLIGVIKAEVHNGFTREQAGGILTLKFLKNLLLTAQTKLYKIGLFAETAPEATGEPLSRWSSYIYDEQLTLSNRNGAAQYFYEGFLGCKFMESSARNTKIFHDLTKKFIQGMDVPETERIVLINALVTYLKADQSPTVSTAAFGEAYLAEDEVRDAYARHMRDADFPVVAVAKDLTDVTTSLRLRKLIFRNQVRLTAPAEGFEDLVTIESVEGDAVAQGVPPRWTRITVKADISGQE